MECENAENFQACYDENRFCVKKSNEVCYTSVRNFGQENGYQVTRGCRRTNYCLRSKKRRIQDHTSLSRVGLDAQNQCRFLNDFFENEEQNLPDRIVDNNLQCIACDNEDWFVPYF